MSEQISIVIGEKIRLRRVELGFTQEFLSKRLEIHQNAISNIENGKAGMSFERLIQISNILNVDLNYFVEINTIDKKQIRIDSLENLVRRLEKRNEILENYILKLLDTNKT